MKRRTLTSLLLSLSLGAGAWAAPPGWPPRAGRATGANALAWAVTRTLAADGNLVWSPFSLRRALLLLRVGSLGESGARLGQLLSLPEDDPEAAARAAETERQQLAGLADSAQWHSAEALFVQRGVKLRADYAARLAALGSLAEAVSFPVEALRRINAWVAGQTAGRIAALLGSLDQDAMVVLVNAVDLQARWAEAFSPKHTTSQPFHTLQGDKPVPTMHAVLPARLASNGSWQLLELRYQGDRLVFDCLLPAAGRPLKSQLAQLGWKEVEALLAGLDVKSLDREEAANAQVEVSLPRFALASKHDQLYPQLLKLGLPRPLDLGGIAPGPMDVSLIVQKARIEVDEQGTRASAATAVVISRGGGGPEQFRADRPFLFLVRDQVSGMVLFTGQVVDPTAP